MSLEVIVVTEPSETVVSEVVSTEVIEVGVAGLRGPTGATGSGTSGHFNPRDFGAVLDGSDETQPFLDAIDAARDAGGGIVEFDGPLGISEMPEFVTGVAGERFLNLSLHGVGFETSILTWLGDDPPPAVLRIRPDTAPGGPTGDNYGGEFLGFALDGNHVASRGIWATNQNGMKVDVAYRNFAENGTDACFEGDGNPGCLLNDIRGWYGMGGICDNWGLRLLGHRNTLGGEFGGTAKGSIFLVVGGSGNVIVAGTDFEGLTVDGTHSLHIASWYTVVEPGVSFEDVNAAIPNARSIYVAPGVRFVDIGAAILGFQNMSDVDYAIELAGSNRDVSIHGPDWNTHCAVADIKVTGTDNQRISIYDTAATIEAEPGQYSRYADLADLLAHTADPDAHGDFLTAAEADAAYDPTGTAAAAVATHAGLSDPHPTYETSAEAAAKVAAHEAASDPHPTYLTAAEGAAAFDAVGAASAGDAAHVGAGDPHPTYETSAEAAAKVSAHEAAGDPHPTYLTAAEGAAAFDAAGAAAAGDASHAGASDPHTGYQKESEKDALSGYPGLTAGGFVLPGQLGSGTPTAAKVLRGDGTWTTHDGTGDPHSQYATDTDLSGHAAAADPHTGYLQESVAAAVATSGSASDLGTGTLPDARIADDAVTFAKIQNFSGPFRLWGRATAGAGDGEEITPLQVAAQVIAEILMLPTGVIAETWPSHFIGGANQAVLQGSGQIYVAYIGLLKGQVVSTISWASGVQAAVTPTFQQSGLYDPTSLGQLAASADLTNTAWAAQIVKPFPMVTPYTITTTKSYIIVLSVTAGTLPTLWVSANLSSWLRTPTAVGRANVGVAALPGTLSAITTGYTHRAYACVS